MERNDPAPPATRPSAGPGGLALVLALLAGASSPPVAWALDSPYLGAPINYLEARAKGPAAALQRRLETGAAALDRSGRRAFVSSVLEALDIPVESQVLVFSKTSFQNDFISPQRPRAIFFNDDSYVGWVQGSDVLEVTSVDPVLGPVFYTLDRTGEGVRGGSGDGQEGGDGGGFIRRAHDCLRCHGSTFTRGYPGNIVRSVYPDRYGFPIFAAGTFRTTQASPLEERWGGWYVTGRHGSMRHLGNVTGTAAETPAGADLDREDGANLVDLAGRIDPSPYLAPHSDIVALLVLEHQAEFQNLLVRAAYETRQALHRQAEMDVVFGRADGRAPGSAPEPSTGTLRIIAAAGERLLGHLLFRDEALLKARVRGTSGFTEAFARVGPRDRRGRSLRDFDLRARIFAYPCSYQIYSPGWAALPAPLKDYLYRRLWEELGGGGKAGTYTHLRDDQKAAIREILLDTLDDLPGYWRG